MTAQANEREAREAVVEAARRYISASESDGYELTDYQRIVKAVRDLDATLERGSGATPKRAEDPLSSTVTSGRAGVDERQGR